MSEVQAALIGATATAFVMVLSNISNRREKTIIDIFKRLNQLDKSVASLEQSLSQPQPPNRNWRNRSNS
tara:strand:- start:714 stop:920 length:207 start_codon:yes stop_codon:yes gene_type:complete